jgi:uncharacterized membrane protein
MTKFSLGILAVVLFRWTPATGKGFLVFFSLLAVLIILAAVLTKYKKTEPEVTTTAKQ